MHITELDPENSDFNIYERNTENNKEKHYQFKLCCRYNWPINEFIDLNGFRNTTLMDDDEEIERVHEEMIRNLKHHESDCPSNLQIIKLIKKENIKYLLWLFVQEEKFKIFIFSNILSLTFSHDKKFLGYYKL